MISSPWDPILRSERRPFCRMKHTHPAVARGLSVVMDGVLVSSCAYIATNSTRVQSAGSEHHCGGVGSDKLLKACVKA